MGIWAPFFCNDKYMLAYFLATSESTSIISTFKPDKLLQLSLVELLPAPFHEAKIEFAEHHRRQIYILAVGSYKICRFMQSLSIVGINIGVEHQLQSQSSA